MASTGEPLSSDPDQFARLVSDAIEAMPARDVPDFLHALADAATAAIRARKDAPVLDLLEALAITHALDQSEDYKHAVKEIENRPAPPVAEDLEALKALYDISA